MKGAEARDDRDTRPTMAPLPPEDHLQHLNPRMALRPRYTRTVYDG
jgi:hypothetical protein